MKPTRINRYHHDVRVCGIEGCHRRQAARGYCIRHYHEVIVLERAPAVQEELFSAGCGVPGCWNPLYDGGMCAGHFTEDFTRGMNERSLRGILARIDMPDDDACWVWRGATNRGGYGVVSYKGALYLVHRLIYELMTGEDVTGTSLDHMCRVTTCCNPAHLEPVDEAENARRHHAVLDGCERCYPAPIPAGGTLEERLQGWGLRRDFTPIVPLAS